jgi:hypothetical protein
MNAFLREARAVDNPSLDLPLRLDRRQDELAHFGENHLIRPSRLNRPDAKAIDAWPKPEQAQ